MNKATKYIRLTPRDREEISRLLAIGRSYRQIAEELGRCPSTISRELRRLRYTRETYRPIFAQQVAHTKRRRPKSNKIASNIRLREYVVRHILDQYWSPQQVAGRLKIEYPEDTTMHVSHETIYTYIFCFAKGELQKELKAALRQKKYRRGPRLTREQRRAAHANGGIQDLVSIDERPKDIEDRIIPGHWEGDLILGRGNHSALGTLVERTTRTTILVRVESKNAEHVAVSFAREMEGLPEQMKLTLTYDRGSEMARHKLFSEKANMKVYFADPQSPWQRGTNENTNGLIRQFFPKGTDFNDVTREEIKKVQDLLNGRPRDTLGYATPYEKFNELLAEKGEVEEKTLMLR